VQHNILKLEIVIIYWNCNGWIYLNFQNGMSISQIVMRLKAFMKDEENRMEER
jgi:hypothetical protein